MAEIEFIEPSSPNEFDDPIIDAEVVAPHGQPCESCGCPLEETDKFCPACGSAHVTESIGVSDDKPTHQRHFRCDNCGSEVSTEPDQRSYVCPFCDSTYVVELQQQTDRQRPEFVVGFSVTRDQALAKFREWIAENSWFRPGDLRMAMLADKQQGVYLPFWSFSMLAQSHWSATIGEYWYRTETYTTRDSKGNTVIRTRQVQETEWWPLSGNHHHYYAGYLVSGSKGLPQDQAERIKPFNLPALSRYEPYFLAGWLSEEYSIERESALQICQQQFYARERSNVAAFLPGNTHRGLEVSTRFSSVNSDLCLLPVYILSYQYRDKVYRFLVNGQTGKCVGDKPLSWQRILLAIFVAALLIAALILGVALAQNG
ncbi:MAG: zinc ribbon domain-containing protein [Planctomycetaceae bacterium]|nr:zinc ribbon domain-containing protein [Planctomycetales bacterium]MCB9925112.1 zinc ribbon domain-containing protein [Planctomycetaceae bacterium]